MSALINKVKFFVFTLFLSISIIAQTNLKGYYLCPVHPGKPNYLNGNMGELRPDHFHAGLDFRTNQDNSSLVYAAADGYISRIIVSEYGYGNALMLKHPNGTTSLYAHLEKFNKQIADYVRQKQYEKQTFALEILFDSTSFLKFKKGESIANAGNTGSSGGPHLHFEIRDKNNYILNPLMFGFTELTDKVSPTFNSIAIRTLDKNSRINNDFGFFEFYPQKISNNQFLIKNLIVVRGLLGLEVSIHDMSEGSWGRNGVTTIEVKMDGKTIYAHDLSSYLMEKTRFINLHVDYEQERTRNIRYQNCYVLNGNELNIYKTDENKGKIKIYDNKVHSIEVIIKDAYDNASTLSFNLQGTEFKQNSEFSKVNHVKPIIKYYLFNNILEVKSKPAFNENAIFYIKGKEIILKSEYTKQNESIYLWDLNTGLPDSVMINKKKQNFNFKDIVVPNINKPASFFNDSLKISFLPNSLFDTLYLEVKKQKDTISIGRLTIPLKSDIVISYTPAQKNIDKQRTAIYNLKWRRGLYKGGTWKGESIVFTTKELGTFTLKTDTTPPTVKFRSTPTSNLITCTILDDMSGIASYKATINGEWLLMNYDPKYSKLWSEKLDQKKPLKGNFVLQVTDNAGNVSILEKVL